MRKKIISGFLALAMVFTHVPANVIALGTLGASTDTQIVNNAFGDNGTNSPFGDSNSNNDAFGGSNSQNAFGGNDVVTKPNTNNNSNETSFGEVYQNENSVSTPIMENNTVNNDANVQTIDEAVAISASYATIEGKLEIDSSYDVDNLKIALKASDRRVSDYIELNTQVNGSVSGDFVQTSDEIYAIVYIGKPTDDVDETPVTLYRTGELTVSHSNIREYYGSIATKPEDPTRNGFNFLGWSKSSTTSSNYVTFGNEGSYYTEDTALYANWEKIGGSGSDEDPDSDPGVDPDPDSGVDPDQDSGVDPDTEVTPDPEVVPDSEGEDQTEGVFTITFNSDGGSEVTGEFKTVNGNLTALPITDPTKAGYTFDGWYLENDKGELTTKVDTNTEFKENTTCIAKWTAVEYTVTITDNPTTDAYTFEPTTVNVQTREIVITANNGETFSNEGFVITPEVKFTVSVAEVEGKSTATLTLEQEAKYTANIVITVALESDSDSGQDLESLYPSSFGNNGVEETETETETVKEEFGGTTKTLGAVKYAPTPFGEENNNATSVMSNTRNTPTTIEYSFTNMPTGLTYELEVWDSKTNQIITTSESITVDYAATSATLKTLTIIPAVTSYDVRFPTDITTDTWGGGTYEVGETVTVTLSSNMKSYFDNKDEKFVTWEIKKDAVTSDNHTEFSSSEISALNISPSLLTETFTFKMPECHVFVWPVSDDVDKLQVSFNVNGGTSVNSLEIAEGGLIDEYLTTTTRDGYTFEGWYKDSTFTNKWNFATDTVTSDRTLYASWTANKITFVTNYNDYYDTNTTSNQKIETNVSVGSQKTLDAGTRDGYSFAYWVWYLEDQNNYSYSGVNYGISNWITSQTSSKTQIIVPPLKEGAVLTVCSVWKPLSATIYVDNILDPESDGDSCYVTISNPVYGDLEGVYNSVSSYTGYERYDFDLADYGTGMYTVEISTTSGQEMVHVLYVEDDSTNTVTIEMLPLDKVVSVTNNTSNVSNITSNNLSEMFTTAELNSNNYITIDMQVNNVTSSSLEAQYINESINSNQTIGLFLDVSLFKNDAGKKFTMQPANSKGLNVTVQLPDSFIDQKSYFVATVHDNMYSTISSANVSYDSASNSISFYTTGLSVFGIGYSGSSSGSGTGSSIGTFIPTAEGYNVPIFQNVMVGQWIEGLGKYQLVHPEPDKYKFAGWYFAETGQALTAEQLNTYFIVTEAILQYGIYPRFVQVDADGNPLTSPVPSTGNSNPKDSDLTLINLF